MAAPAEDGARQPWLHRRRMSAPTPRARAAPLRLPPCRPLPLSLEALDLSPAASPAQALASLRFLVLSYLADLERRLALFDTDSPAARALALASLRFLVLSYLADLERRLALFDTDSPAARALDMLRRPHPQAPLSYVPTLSARLRTLHRVLADEFPSLDFTLPSRPTFDFDFSRPTFDFEFSRPSFDFDFDFEFDFTTPRELLDAFRADVDAFLTSLPASLPSLPALPSLLRVSSRDAASASASPKSPPAQDPEADAADAAAHTLALTLSAHGTKHLSYPDLPPAWQNNAFIAHNYRFIPLHRPHRLLRSLLPAPRWWHNESLNVYTHLVPLFLWGGDMCRSG
ncbi:hypothetical protein B0H16DRAFT_1812776 [Mycena metata]|uniref:Uncharacterized protein n=1 Tax=Mycena metata TaxID=1033252 RepID=A0AAD7JB57_9AGAR|nr:hypothetical protein B0H16DRAFT_1812776 [Mycena metata]